MHRRIPISTFPGMGQGDIRLRPAIERPSALLHHLAYFSGFRVDFDTVPLLGLNVCPLPAVSLQADPSLTLLFGGPHGAFSKTGARGRGPSPRCLPQVIQTARNKTAPPIGPISSRGVRSSVASYIDPCVLFITTTEKLLIRRATDRQRPPHPLQIGVITAKLRTRLRPQRAFLPSALVAFTHLPSRKLARLIILKRTPRFPGFFEYSFSRDTFLEGK